MATYPVDQPTIDVSVRIAEYVTPYHFARLTLLPSGEDQKTVPDENQYHVLESDSAQGELPIGDVLTLTLELPVLQIAVEWESRIELSDDIGGPWVLADSWTVTLTPGLTGPIDLHSWRPDDPPTVTTNLVTVAMADGRYPRSVDWRTPSAAGNILLPPGLEYLGVLASTGDLPTGYGYFQKGATYKIDDNLHQWNGVAWTAIPVGGVSAGTATNLATSRTSTEVTVTSSTGTDATLVAADGSNAGILTVADKATLDSATQPADLASGLSGKADTSHSHAVGDLTATGTASDSTYLRGDNTWATPAGAGGVTDHGALTGLTDDDHALYALADGTRGAFASTADIADMVTSPTAGVELVFGTSAEIDAITPKVATTLYFKTDSAGTGASVSSDTDLVDMVIV